MSNSNDRQFNRNFNVLLSHDLVYQNFILEDGRRIISTVKRNRKKDAHPISISLATKSSFVVNKLLPAFEKYGLNFVPILGTKSIIIAYKDSIELPSGFDDGFIIKEENQSPIFFKRNFEQDLTVQLEDYIDTMFRPERIQTMYLSGEGDSFILSVQNINDKTLIAPRALFSERGIEISDPSSIHIFQAIWPEFHLEVKYSDEEGQHLRAMLQIPVLEDKADDFFQIKRSYGDDKIAVQPYGKKLDIEG